MQEVGGALVSVPHPPGPGHKESKFKDRDALYERKVCAASGRRLAHSSGGFMATFTSSEDFHTTPAMHLVYPEANVTQFI